MGLLPQENMSTYLESDAVKAAKKQTQEHLEKRPSYTSRWEDEMAKTLQTIRGREFRYDVLTDPVYDSYRRAYTRKGLLAMEDTLGRASALTGGYGNSYAQSAAQESYNGYMQALTEQIPQLYQLAQARFDGQTKALQAQYDQYLQQEKADRESFDDAFDRWLSELKLLQSQQEAVSREDYDRFEDQRQWDQDHPQTSDAPGDPGNTGTSGDSGGYDNGSVSQEDIRKIQAVLGVTVDGKWGRESRQAAGDVDADTAWRNYLSEYGG